MYSADIGQMHQARRFDNPHRRSLRQLADPAAVFSADILCSELERYFALHPEVTSVVVRYQDCRLEIVTRRRLTVELAGPIGHGRSLYGHRPVSVLPGGDEPLILDGGTPLEDAGTRALERRPGYRYDDILVTGADGFLGTVTVAGLYDELARVHAYRAVHDRLTGLPNRELFVERLHAIEGPLATLFIDLDDFKSVNDSLGHSAGDELLIVAAERLSSITTDDETVARLGGDEFGFIQPGGNEASARDAAVRIAEALRVPIALEDRSITLNASVGIAISDGRGDRNMLMRNADLAMYEAKRKGKRRHAIYRREMFRDARRRLQLKTDLTDAERNGEFRLVYQPIVRVADGTTIAVEALIRWMHPRLGKIAPLDFVPLAEESGVIAQIGRWVLREACHQLRSWERDYGVALGVSVNVSPGQLEHAEFASDVREALTSAALDGERLTLEVTETAIVSDNATMLAVVGELASMGVSLALDDFGTGFSSLDRLEQLPIRTLKIDKEFVTRIAGGGSTKTLRGLLSLAQALEVETIVEGIETAEQLAALSELGYRLGQGYHLSRPLEVEDMGRTLATHQKSVREASWRGHMPTVSLASS